MEDKDEEDTDAFWEIALMQHSEGAFIEEDNDDEEDDDDEAAANDNNGHGGSARGAGKVSSYRLPNTSITLKLARLPPEDGVWSPVGADAWYASALLSALLLKEAVSASISTPDSSAPNNQQSGIFPKAHDKSNPLRILELGSGAKALSGFAAAATLSKLSTRFPSWTVTLTDNQEDVLRQLKHNVVANQATIIATENCQKQHIHVEYLDWGMDVNLDQQVCILDAHVVIGSELAYTAETATALAKILSTLLKRNPDVTIWIVQVTDRHGWSEIVLPTLESLRNVVVEPIPLTRDIHGMASELIPMGEALNRESFGAVQISKAPT